MIIQIDKCGVGAWSGSEHLKMANLPRSDDVCYDMEKGQVGNGGTSSLQDLRGLYDCPRQGHANAVMKDS